MLSFYIFCLVCLTTTYTANAALEENRKYGNMYGYGNNGYSISTYPQQYNPQLAYNRPENRLNYPYNGYNNNNKGQFGYGYNMYPNQFWGSPYPMQSNWWNQNNSNKKPSKNNKHKKNIKGQSNATIVLNGDNLAINGQKVTIDSKEKQGITVNFSKNGVMVNRKKIPEIVSNNPGVNVRFKDDELIINGKKVPGVKANQETRIRYKNGKLKVNGKIKNEFDGIVGKGRIYWNVNSNKDSDEESYEGESEDDDEDEYDDDDDDDEEEYGDEDELEKKYPWIAEYKAGIKENLSKKNKFKTNKTNNQIDQSRAYIVLNDNELVINGKTAVTVNSKAKQGITINFSKNGVTVNREKIPDTVSNNQSVSVLFKDDELFINGKKVPDVKANQGTKITYEDGVLKVNGEIKKVFDGIKGKGTIVWGEDSSIDSDEDWAIPYQAIIENQKKQGRRQNKNKNK